MSSSIRNIAITTGGVAEDILPARLGRTRLEITPITEDLWVNFNETAAVDNGVLIPTDTTRVFDITTFPEVGGAVSAFSATTGADIGVVEM